MKVYNELKKEYEAKGFTPFVCLIKWPPLEEAAAIKRYLKIFATPEGEGIRGVHAWNLIGRNSMIVIGWMNSAVSLQKFCTSITIGTGISMEVCPAVDHFGLEKALKELESRREKTGA
jgi:hypothetical protein